jgi:hypothetical protein
MHGGRWTSVFAWLYYVSGAAYYLYKWLLIAGVTGIGITGTSMILYGSPSHKMLKTDK